MCSVDRNADLTFCLGTAVSWCAQECSEETLEGFVRLDKFRTSPFLFVNSKFGWTASCVTVVILF